MLKKLPMNENTKYTLLQVLPSLHAGGVERGTIDIAIAAKKAGFNSIVASAGGELTKTLNKAEIKHITLNLNTKNPFKILRNSCKILKILRENNVSILHARSRAPAWSCYLATKKYDTHLITTYHGFYSENLPLKSTYNQVMTKGKKVIAVSNSIAEHIKTKYKLNDKNIAIIHRGVDINRFNKNAISQHREGEIRRNWKITPNSPPILFFPGRFTRWKGQHIAIEALKNTSFPCKIIFAGDTSKHPNYLEEIKISAQKLPTNIEVLFTDVERDMPAAYKVADCVLCTSIRPEAFGRIPIEAQALGTIVIATDIGGFTETIIHNKTGFLVPTENPKVLAQNIEKALNLSTENRINISSNAIENVKNNFSLKKMQKKTLALYNQLLET